MKSKWNIKKFSYDIFIDIVGGVLIGLGIYNFAANAEFPLAGVSGLALILYRLFNIPIGWGTIALNIPIVIICFKTLGKEFFARSIRSLIISSLITDYVVTLLPVYSGDRMLAALCTGIFSGLGYALIFMNHSSTAGMDFVCVAIHSKHPHISLGKIVFSIDCAVVLLGGAIFKDVDATIYGLIISYFMTVVIDKITYGINSGKIALIVTDEGQKVANMIDENVGRGSTILRGCGSYTGVEKDIVMCASNNKEMYAIREMARKADEKAFVIIMESNEVLGEGFGEEIQ